MKRHRGFSLLEVLAAIGVLSIGLLGLASLLPIGRLIIAEATKADRAGNCGRAALRDVIVRRMLDYHNWYDSSRSSYVDNQNYNGNKPWYDQDGNPTANLPASFLVDPEGCAAGLTTLASIASNGSISTALPRTTLANPTTSVVINSSAMADPIFRAQDDLVVSLPEEMTPPQPVGRPQNLTLSNTGSVPHPLDYTGQYSWFLTVTPQANSPTRFNVSVVVCFGRNLTATGERGVQVTQFYDQPSGTQVAIGGGSVVLAREINDIAGDNPTAGIALKENDWVALYSTSTGLCRRYRVASIGDDTHYLTLVGPDWPVTASSSGKDILVALGQSVAGVYTTTVDVDSDPTWTN